MSAGERIAVGQIEGLRVGRYPGKINTTVFVFRIGTTVIDSGPPNQWPEVSAFLAEKPPELVLATHHHEDHSGNLAPIKKRWSPTILAPAESLQWLAGGFTLQTYRRIVWGRPERCRAEAPTGPITISDGSELDPVLLPGHSPDMTCFVDRQRGHLYGADLYVSRRQRYLRADEDLRGILESLEKALTLDFDTLLCSHAGVIENAKERLRERLDYFRMLCGKATGLRSRGWSVGRITRRLLGREDTVAFFCLGHYSKRNLIEGCLAANGS